MDVVRKNVQALGGRIGIHSKLGQGSSFSLSLPLTLAVVDGMIVTVGDQTYVIPLSHIVESLRPSDRAVTAIGPGPMDTPFFYGQESADAQAYHKTAAALSAFSKTGLTDIEDIVPYIRFLVSDGWWMTGQTILVNGGYTTK